MKRWSWRTGWENESNDGVSVMMKDDTMNRDTYWSRLREKLIQRLEDSQVWDTGYDYKGATQAATGCEEME